MATSDVRPEVEIWPYSACAMKNAQYSPYLGSNRRNLYRNSSVIVHLAMGQTPRSTERISNSYVKIIHDNIFRAGND